MDIVTKPLRMDGSADGLSRWKELRDQQLKAEKPSEVHSLPPGAASGASPLTAERMKAETMRAGRTGGVGGTGTTIIAK